MYNRTTPKVSIVIPSWFTKDQSGKYGDHETFWFACECIKRLKQVTDSELYELIIVDNGSTLTTQTLLKGKTPWSSDSEIMTPERYFSFADIIIRNKTNLGFAPACNQAFNIARGEYIICLNNDILVWENWLMTLLNMFLLPLTPKVGIVMPALIIETQDAKEAIALKEIDLRRNAGRYGVGAEFGSLWVTKKSILDEVRELNKKLSNKDEVFDEDFKLGMGEDRYLWQQIRKLGYETYRCHDTRVFHQGNMTIGKVKNRKEFTLKNREILEDKKKKMWG